MVFLFFCTVKKFLTPTQKYGRLNASQKARINL